MSCVDYEGDNVTISKQEYEKLVADSNFLECLEQSGVDNWEWYDAARDLYATRYGEDS